MLRQKRKEQGFTLIEVALAIALGIVIVLGAVLGYGAVRASQSEREGRNRLGSLKGILEAYRASNNGSVLAFDALRTLWSQRRPQDVLNSPWGGASLPNGTGAGISSVATNLAGLNATPGVNVPANLGGIGYATAAGGSFTVFDRATSATIVAKEFAIFYFDKNGDGAWFVTVGD